MLSLEKHRTGYVERRGGNFKSKYFSYKYLGFCGGMGIFPSFILCVLVCSDLKGFLIACVVKLS